MNRTTLLTLHHELQRRDNFKMLDFYSEVLVSHTRGPRSSGRCNPSARQPEAKATMAAVGSAPD